MLIDFLLVLGALFSAFGVLKILAQINNRTSPMMGILIVIIGVTMLFIAQDIMGESINSRDIPNALFNIIGRLN